MAASGAATMHFQDIIGTLNRFWADQGCLLLQPYDTEKGAGRGQAAGMRSFWPGKIRSGSSITSRLASKISVYRAPLP